MSDNKQTDDVKTTIELGVSTQKEEYKQDLISSDDNNDSMDEAYAKTVVSFSKQDTKQTTKSETSTGVLLPADEGETYAANGEEPNTKIFTKAELIIYVLFLVVFVTMAVLSRGNGDLSYTQTRAIRDPMMMDFFKPWNYDSEKDFVSSTTIADIYSFLTTVAIPLVMSDERNGTIIVQSQQILLGGIRLRQTRLQTEACVKDVFAEMDCYSTEELTANSITFDTTTFMYATDDELDDQSWRAKFGSYPGGGYYVDLYSDPSRYNGTSAYTNAIAIINELESIKWIDAATRFVVIDFTTYNPSSTLHTVVRIGWELPSGGVFGTDELKTWKFDRYTQTSGIALLVLHVIFLIMLVVMAINVIRQMYKETCWKCGKDENGRNYYWQVTKWRYLDFLNMVFFYIAFIMVVYNQSAVNNMDVYNTHDYISFRKLQYSFTVESYVTALTSVLLCLRVFKYIGVNKRLQFLFLIFRTAGYDLMMFCVVLGVFFMTWGLAGFLTFNSDVDDFRSLSFSLFNMLRYTVAEMDYDALNLASPAWGSFFYFSWSLLMLLILINVFIAIINDAYAEVQEELSGEEKVEFSMVNMFGKFKNFFVGGKLEDFDADGDGIVDMDEFIQHTKCTKQEAEDFFLKYDVDGSGGLSKDEFEAAKIELERQRADAKAAKINRRVGRKNIGGGSGGNIPLEEWNELKSLLVAVLETSKSGRKTLQKRKDSIHSPR